MKKISLILVVALLSATNFAVAHGDKPHSKKPEMVKKEQKEWGIAGDAKAVKRTIEVSMTDKMRFSPDNIAVAQGDTIRFRIKNTGVLMHEFVIGTKKENETHAALMMKFPNMEHDEPYMAHVPAGKAGEIVWTFNKPGEFDFACLIAGHFQSGMIGKITVAALQAPAK